ncbi:glycerate kinase type-2 family protein [Kaarinaea lacus]
MNNNNSRRTELLSIFEDALRAVNGALCTEQYLQNYPVSGDVCVIAIGKAACSMASGAQKVLGERIRDSLVITKRGWHKLELPDLNVIEAAHPVPDQSSLDAGQQLLDLLERLPLTTTLLFLISGGTSALVEVLPGSVMIAELEALNSWLLNSGLPIATINAIRKRVSRIKGGRLAHYLGGRKTTVLFLSDVQGDDPAVIGSGLLAPSTETSNAIQVETLPEDIRQLLSSAVPMPDPHDPCFNNITWKIIANLQQAMDAANVAAKSRGYQTIVHEEYIQGDAVECGKYVAGILQQQPGQLHIWGGETTVHLPENPGKGGRCQSLALSAALALQTRKDWCLLAAGTDGDDGISGAAGVCIDAHSIKRGRKKLGNNAQVLDYLNNADAGSFFEASGDIIITGPTGTNVTDLVFGFCSS